MAFLLAEEAMALIAEVVEEIAGEVATEEYVAPLVQEAPAAIAEMEATEATPLIERGSFSNIQQQARVAGDLTGQAATAYTAGMAMASMAGKKSLKRKDRAPQSGAQPSDKPPIKRRKGGPQDTPMPPKGVSKSTHWYDRTRKKWVKRKRPLKKRPSMRKKAYKKRTTRTKRTYKKKTVKRKFMRASGSRKYETHGIINRPRVSYFGFQAHGGRDELMFQVGDALVRSICRKFGLKVVEPDAKINVGIVLAKGAQSFRILYAKRKYPVAHSGEGDYYTTTNVASGDLVNLTMYTFNAHAQKVAEELKTRAQVGEFPRSLIVYEGTAGTGTEIMHIDYKFGDSMIALTTKCRIKLRNVTRNDDTDAHDASSIMKNPLEGYAYQFSGDVPMPKESLLYADREESITADQHALSRFLKRDYVRGVAFGPQAAFTSGASGPGHNVTTDNLDPNDINIMDDRVDEDGETGTQALRGVFADDRYMSSPPTGNSVFMNCKKTHKVVMPVGREMIHNIGYKYQGRLNTFLEKFNQDAFRTAPIGTCFWLGLKQKFKNSLSITHGTDGPAKTDHNHEDVSVEYDTETRISASFAFVRAERTPTGVNTVELNSVFT
jgi:hypothetical protein